MSDLATLLMVQDRDSAIDHLRYRRDHLPEHEELARGERELSAIAVETADWADRKRLADVAQQEAEAEMAGVASRIESLDKQMYAGTVTAAKDLQAMAHEVESLKGRRGEVENRVLEAMGEVETAESAIAVLAERREGIEQEATRLRGAITEAQATIDAEIDTGLSTREGIASGVPGELMIRYEALRKRLGGVAVARLSHGRCEGCHLSLPSAALDRIRHAGEGAVSTCEECGRILVPH